MEIPTVLMCVNIVWNFSQNSMLFFHPLLSLQLWIFTTPEKICTVNWSSIVYKFFFVHYPWKLEVHGFWSGNLAFCYRWQSFSIFSHFLDSTSFTSYCSFFSPLPPNFKHSINFLTWSSLLHHYNLVFIPSAPLKWLSLKAITDS